MKKQIILVGAIAAMCLGLFLTSCDKNNGCSCSVVYYDGYRDTLQATAADLERYGATSCAQFATLGMLSEPDITSAICAEL